jgi:uncharacterized protein (TIGR02266 family)
MCIAEDAPFQEVALMTTKSVLLGLDTNSFPTASDFFSNREKFSVTVVHDGIEALGRIAEEKPDIAILDVNLTRKGGADCCRQVRKKGLSPETLIVLEVCVRNPRDVKKCLESDCNALLVKPLYYEHLAGIITRLLFGQRSIQPRFDVRLPVRYGTRHDHWIDNFSVNLSTGGVFLETTDFLPVGTCIKVVFTLPRGICIECAAQVTWLNDPQSRSQPLLPAGVGLKFLDIEKKKVTALRNFLFSEERLFSA